MPKVTKKETTKVSKRGAKNEEVKQKKKKRAKKDPNAPKNPLSAYLLFCNDHRDSVKAKNPDASFGKLPLGRDKKQEDQLHPCANIPAT